MSSRRQTESSYSDLDDFIASDSSTISFVSQNTDLSESTETDIDDPTSESAQQIGRPGSSAAALVSSRGASNQKIIIKAQSLKNNFRNQYPGNTWRNIDARQVEFYMKKFREQLKAMSRLQPDQYQSVANWLEVSEHYIGLYTGGVTYVTSSPAKKAKSSRRGRQSETMRPGHLGRAANHLREGYMLLSELLRDAMSGQDGSNSRSELHPQSFPDVTVEYVPTPIIQRPHGLGSSAKHAIQIPTDTEDEESNSTDIEEADPSSDLFGPYSAQEQDAFQSMDYTERALHGDFGILSSFLQTSWHPASKFIYHPTYALLDRGAA